jgi:hypothetical protein
MKQTQAPVESASVNDKPQSFNMRLSPKVRFAAELVAEKQRRSLASLIEFALVQVSESVEVARRGEDDPAGRETYGVSAWRVTEEVWDPREADRVCNLATQYRETLLPDQLACWNVIKEVPAFWIAREIEGFSDSVVNRSLVRQHWTLVKYVAQGKKTVADLTHAVTKEKKRG